MILWAAAECGVDEPLGALSVVDAADRVNSEQEPLAATAIVVALKERGYRPEAEPRALRTTLQEGFKRNRARFHRGEDGRWVLAR